jgi:hypothetical protein
MRAQDSIPSDFLEAPGPGGGEFGGRAKYGHGPLTPSDRAHPTAEGENVRPLSTATIAKRSTSPPCRP